MEKISDITSLMAVLDDIPFLYHRLFGRKKEEQSVSIQPQVRGMSVPISVPLNKNASAILSPYGTKPKDKRLKNLNYDPARNSPHLLTDKQIAKLSKFGQLLEPQNVFRESKNQVVKLPQGKTVKVFKSILPNERQQQEMEVSKAAKLISKLAAAQYEYQGQEVVEARTLQQGAGAPDNQSSVQKLQAEQQLAKQYAQMPPNVVEMLKQYLVTKKNNDQNWDMNGDKLK